MEEGDVEPVIVQENGQKITKAVTKMNLREEKTSTITSKTHVTTPTAVAEAVSKSSKFLAEDIDVFIMSEAGKPIYCYTEREDAITLMGVCVALVNYVIKKQNDILRSIHTRRGLHINFAVRSPLVIVVVCRRHSCFDVETLINQINAQIITTITLKSLKSVYQQAPTYDLKRLIHNNEFKTMDILVESISTPIADMFTTFKNRRHRPSSEQHLFDNVISFYTSTTIAAPRTTTSGSNLAAITNGTNPVGSSGLLVINSKPSVLSRVYVPIAIIPANIREQMTSIVNGAVSNFKDVVFSILFQIEKDDMTGGGGGGVSMTNGHNGPPPPTIPNSYSSTRTMNTTTDESEEDFIDALEEFSNLSSVTGANSFAEDDSNVGGDQASNFGFTASTQSNESGRSAKALKLLVVCNHNSKFRINPLDIQLIYALIKASDNQLSSTESLWLPLCLTRVDPNRFLYAHISYLGDKYCLVLLDVDHGDFQRCQQAKETIQSRLNYIQSTLDPLTGGMVRSRISELDKPQLQYICHQTPRHCIMWQASIQTEFSSLNYYLVDRMQRSSFKTLWLRSGRDHCALLGWHSATFQLYAQFDEAVTRLEALDTVQAFLKWFKKEEDKLIIKDA